MSVGDFFNDEYNRFASSTGYKVNSPDPSWESLEKFEKPFGQLITYILGSDIDQDIKDTFVGKCIPLKEFRKYVKEYFPKYEKMINLWEILHGEPKSI